MPGGKELLAQIEMDAPLYSRPAVVGDALYLATANRLRHRGKALILNALRASISHSAVVRLRRRPTISGGSRYYSSSYREASCDP